MESLCLDIVRVVCRYLDRAEVVCVYYALKRSSLLICAPSASRFRLFLGTD